MSDTPSFATQATLDTLAPMLRHIDHTLVWPIDGTMLSEMHRCPRAHWYRDVRKRVRTTDDMSLTFGQIIHEVLHERYAQYGTAQVEPEELYPVLEAAYARLKATYARLKPDAVEEAVDPLADALEPGKRDYLHLGRAKDVLAAYLDHYGAEPWTIVGTEQSFRRPLGHVTLPDASLLPVHWEGRYDLTVRNPYGDWVVDVKTTSKWSDNPWRQWRMSSSLLGYCWNHWQATGTPPCGYVIRAVIVRPPLQTSPRKNSLPRDQNEEESFPVTTERLVEWQRNTLATLQTYVDYAARDYWPQHDKAGFNCSFCGYLDLCAAPDVETRELILQGGDFRENTWSPHVNAADTIKIGIPDVPPQVLK